jgi:hypothetical protein
MRRKPTALTVAGFVASHEKIKGGVGKHITIHSAASYIVLYSLAQCWHEAIAATFTDNTMLQDAAVHRLKMMLLCYSRISWLVY